MQEFRVKVDSVHRKEIVFSPDGRMLAVGAKAFTLIDTTNGTLHEIPEHRAYWGFAFVRDGAEIALSALNDWISVCDLVSGQTRRYTVERGFARGVAARSTADTFFTAVRLYGQKTTIREIATADLTERALFAEIDDTIDRLVLSADGNWLAGRCVNALRVWNVSGSTRPARASTTIPFEGTGDFALSTDGACVATVNSRLVSVWDTKTGQGVFSSGKHRRGVTAVACNPTKPLIATGDNAGKVFFWDHTGRVLTKFDWGFKQVSGLTFAPDGLRCAALSGTGKVVVWDVDA